ncbi:MAG: archaemetzincin family Zn-dependent metalloprotease [bacterium]
MIGIYQQKDLDLFELAEKAIRESFKYDTLHQGYISLPKNSYDPLRQQYDAAVILNYVAEMNDSYRIYKLCLVKVDIYTPNMNFIFGLANPLRKTAVVSTYRLVGNQKEERISKEIVHEIGHLFGLTHCMNHECIMRFSKTVQDTDEKKKIFCADCRSKIE